MDFTKPNFIALDKASRSSIPNRVPLLSRRKGKSGTAEVMREYGRSPKPSRQNK